MYAVTQRQVGPSAALIDFGADVRATTQAGWTALHYAARDGAPAALVTLLLEAWADPGALDGAGDTPEDVAARVGNQAFIDAIRSFEDAIRARLVEAIANIDGATFVAALECGADVNQVDSYGQTPLMYAVAANQVGTVRRLLAAGARVDARSGAGWTALHYAARSGISDAIATELMDGGASLTATNGDGDTAQALAHREGNASYLAGHERFEAAARSRAEAERRTAADRSTSPTTAPDRAPDKPTAADDTCTPLVTRGGTQAVVIEGTAQAQDAFWRRALSSVFGSSVSADGGNTYVGVDTFRRAQFTAEVPYAGACSGGRAVVDLNEVRACAVQFDASSMAGWNPREIQLHLNGQSVTRVRVELPWSGGRGLDRLATYEVTTLQW